MNVIDTVPADSLEVGDTVWLDNEEIEVQKMLDCDDTNGVSFEGYSLTSGIVQSYEVPYDLRVDILGA